MLNKYLFFIPFLFFLFNSCSDDNVINEYELSISVIPVNGGIVSPSTGTYPEGSNVSLIATPSSDYEFIEWIGGLIGNSNPTTLIMDSDKSVTAVFQKKFTLIPNANFEQVLIDLNIDSEGILNGQVLTSDISGVIYLPLFDSNISDLTGIESFINLKKLDCYNNQLTSLDISQNTALKELNCHNNQLTSLDVSQNTALTSLVCFDNQLTSLDVSQNTALATLSCSNNQLTSLDVSLNLDLTGLYCRNNQFTSLDVHLNTALDELYCSDNQLTSLDVSQNTALLELYIPFNQLTNLDVNQNRALTKLVCRDNQLTSLDVSQNVALDTLNCSNNQLRSLNVKNGNNSIISGFISSGNNDLQCIQVDDETIANLGQLPYNMWIKDIVAGYFEDCDTP